MPDNTTPLDTPPAATEVEEPRYYQIEAIKAICGRLADGGIGQLHAACGSGKTLIAQRAAERLLPDGGTVAVLAPSLALIAQTITSWQRRATQQMRALAVCFDDTVGDAPVHLADLHTPATTDPVVISQWLRSTPVGGGSMRLIAGTYRSADRLAEAVREYGPLDLLVLDEAHHLTGRADAVTKQVASLKWLPAVRRLYMTATPRIGVATHHGHLSMDDAEVFGPVLYAYPFARGIADGYLDDYRVLVIGVRDREARALLTDERHEYVERLGGPSLQTVAAQAALVKARTMYGLQRVLTFHHRVKEAAEFARTLGSVASQLGVREPDAAHVHGTMPHRLRHSILDRLRHPDQDGWAVVSNARCLGEGVDVPAVDGVLFAHPKKSAVDIVQAVGRALRRHADTPRVSTIILPLVVPEEDGEIGDLDPGRYATLWQVVRALRAHDEPLGADLDTQRAYIQRGIPLLPEKVTVVLPDGTSTKLLEQLTLLLVRQTTSSWWEGYGYARAYHAEHGNVLVPVGYRTSDGYKLGSWLAECRYHYRKGWLPSDRVAALEKLGMVWEPGETKWQAAAQAARAYHAKHGHLRPSRAEVVDGVALAKWLSKQRLARAAGKLAEHRIAFLDALGMEWSLDAEAIWKLGLEKARAYHAEHGHLRVPRTYTTPDKYKLGDWLNTQRTKYRKGLLPSDRVAALEELGMVWDQHAAKWQECYQAACAYYEKHGHLRVPHTYTTPDGIKLGSWILYQRQLRRGVKPGGISPERIAALDRIGMVW